MRNHPREEVILYALGGLRDHTREEFILYDREALGITQEMRLYSMIGRLEGLHKGRDYTLSSGGLRDHTRKEVISFALGGLRHHTWEEGILYDWEA